MCMPEPENEEPVEDMLPPPCLLPQLELDDLEEAMPDFFEQEMRRESETSLSSEASLVLSMERKL